MTSRLFLSDWNAAEAEALAAPLRAQSGTAEIGAEEEA